jgi:hypothetical protein
MNSSFTKGYLDAPRTAPRDPKLLREQIQEIEAILREIDQDKKS